MKQTKTKMQQDQLMGKSNLHFEITIPNKQASSGKKIRTVRKDDPFTFDKPVFNPESKLKMKGIIGGVSNKKQQNERKAKSFKNLSKRQSRRKIDVQPIDFERDLDIDEVIPREHQMLQQNYFQSEGSQKKANTSFQTLNEFNANEEVDFDPNVKLPNIFKTLEPGTKREPQEASL